MTTSWPACRRRGSLPAAPTAAGRGRAAVSRSSVAGRCEAVRSPSSPAPAPIAAPARSARQAAAARATRRRRAGVSLGGSRIAADPSGPSRNVPPEIGGRRSPPGGVLDPRNTRGIPSGLRPGPVAPAAGLSSATSREDPLEDHRERPAGRARELLEHAPVDAHERVAAPVVARVEGATGAPAVGARLPRRLALLRAGVDAADGDAGAGERRMVGGAVHGGALEAQPARSQRRLERRAHAAGAVDEAHAVRGPDHVEIHIARDPPALSGAEGGDVPPRPVEPQLLRAPEGEAQTAAVAEALGQREHGR